MDKKERFNEITMQQGHSVPFQVKEHLKSKRKWEEGLTVDELRKKVKMSIVKFARLNLKDNKRKVVQNKKVSKGTIYNAVSKVNRFSDPSFYIVSSFGYLVNGKKEFRYFVPKEDKHFFEEEKKIRDTIQRKVERESNLQTYRNIEVPLEIKHQQIQSQNE
jgi:hypothetical protein|tara:strand:- start:853 stop:1335 length:483 start_codon:yes stop_codon:yes gene_type:complete